jgi:hypothetical protein
MVVGDQPPIITTLDSTEVAKVDEYDDEARRRDKLCVCVKCRFDFTLCCVNHVGNETMCIFLFGTTDRRLWF